MAPKILLVDDEAGIRKVLGIFLTDYGYQVSTAKNGEEGLHLFKKIRPTIVLTDIKMPGMGTFVSEGYIDLPPDFQKLCSYVDNVGGFDDLVWSDHQLAISYECGKPVAAGGNGSLLGEPPDYYRVEVEIELVPTGGGGF